MLKHRITQFLQSENNRSSLLNFVISICLIILFFHIRYGLGILNPSETAWLMKYDWAQHYMGWYFYRFEPWTFPLGNMQSLFYPIGTNIGYTDSIPLIAIPLKLLSPILPEQFQYHGLWLCLTHILVAFFSIRLLNLLKIRGIAQLIAVILIVFNPALMHRAMHIALASHWVVVANLWIYFLDPKVVPKRKILLYQFLLLIAGGLINPYFALVNGGFLFILALRFWLSDKIFNLKQVVLYVSGSAILLAGSWLITGFFSLSSTNYLGVLNAYGQFSWNMSSLWNPFTYDRHEDYYTHNLSSYLPARELVRWEQYESFSYLGLGLLLLSALVIIWCLFYSPIRNRVKNLFKQTPIILLFFLTLAITLFAISNIVTYNDKVLFSFPLPTFTKLFTDIFRASGRYIQAFYYLWIFFLVFIVSRTFNKNSYTVLALFLVLVVQFADIRQMIFNRKLIYEPYQVKINETYWDPIIKSCDKLLFLPPLQSNYLTHDDWHYFSWLAIKNRKPVSIGHIARIDLDASQAFARTMLDQIAEQKLDSTAVYVTLPGYYSQFLSNYFSKKVDIVMLDAYMVIATTNHKYPSVLSLFGEIKKKYDQQFIQEHFFSSVPKLIKTSVPEGNAEIKSGIYEITECVGTYTLKGWCFIDDKISNGVDSVNILLKDVKSNIFKAPAVRFATPDVADYFHKAELATSGFESVVDITRLTNGSYQLGLELRDSLSQTLEHKWLDNSVLVMNPAQPVQITWNERLDSMRSDINVMVTTPNGLKIEGWAFMENKIPMSETYVSIIGKNSKVAFMTTPVHRADVGAFFNDPDLAGSGFVLTIGNKSLSPGTYTIGYVIHDVKKDVYYQHRTSRSFEVNSSGTPIVKAVETKATSPLIIFPKPKSMDEAPRAGTGIKGFIDKVSDQDEFYSIEGWSFIEDKDDSDSKINLVLQSGDDIMSIPCKRRFRPDLKGAFHNKFKTDSSGFMVDLRKEYFKKGKYQLSVLIQNSGSTVYLPLTDSIKF